MSERLPARHTDPDTSHAAAAVAVTRRPRVRDHVLIVLREEGPLSHERLVAAYRRRYADGTWPRASESSIRTRVSELVTDGEAEAVPDLTTTSRMGNRARLWRATNV